MENIEHPPTPPTEHEANEEHEQRAPRGALVFVLVMAIAYAIYWFAEWYNIVVIRGGAQ